MLNVLILCTHNSARSALGEAMLICQPCHCARTHDDRYFSGIAPTSALMFVLAQIIGALLGWGGSCALQPRARH